MTNICFKYSCSCNISVDEFTMESDGEFCEKCKEFFCPDCCWEIGLRVLCDDCHTELLTKFPSKYEKTTKLTDKQKKRLIDNLDRCE